MSRRSGKDGTIDKQYWAQHLGHAAAPKLTWPNGSQSAHERENQPAARRVSQA